jgi:hypothetical protein
MLDSVFLFVKQILRSGGIRILEYPRKYYQELLTGISSLAEHPLVFIPETLDFAKDYPGTLVVDDTNNPKYGLKRLTQTLLNLSIKGYRRGYKIVLFLYVTPQELRLPLGFALCHKESKTPAELALEGFSQLRNHHGLKPQRVLGDGAYGTQEILKRLSDYGWPCIFRVANSRKLSGQQVRHLIPRGYGEVKGKLDNGRAGCYLLLDGFLRFLPSLLSITFILAKTGLSCSSIETDTRTMTLSLLFRPGFSPGWDPPKKESFISTNSSRRRAPSGSPRLVGSAFSSRRFSQNTELSTVSVAPGY